MRFAAFILACCAAIAQTAPAKSVIGSVTAVDSDAHQLSLRTDNGANYKVMLDQGTAYKRIAPGETDVKKATAIDLKDITTGDRVLARGPVAESDHSVTAKTIYVISKTDLAQKQSQEEAAWHSGITGKVTAINPDNKEITVIPRVMNPKPVTVTVAPNTGFLRYAQDSYKFSDAKPSSMADIQPGDVLRARGAKSEDGSHFKADQILTGSFQTLAGTVISVDPAKGTLRLTDLQTKKPVEFQVGHETLVRQLPVEMATMIAFRMRGAGNQGGTGQGGGPGMAGAHSGRPEDASGGPVGARAGRPAAMNATPQAAGASGDSHPEGGAGGVTGRFPGAGANGNFDLQAMLERLPAVSIAELKPGDALIVSGTQSTNGQAPTAITVVAGVEPFLRAAPKNNAGQVNLGAWSFDGGAPAEQ